MINNNILLVFIIFLVSHGVSQNEMSKYLVRIWSFLFPIQKRNLSTF